MVTLRVGVAFVTVCVIEAEVPGVNTASPVYCAVIVSIPTGNTLVIRPSPDVAPPTSGRVPSAVAPLKKVTLPVGVPPAPVTVAFNATGCPYVVGLLLLVTTVVLTVRIFVSVKVTGNAP